MKKNLCSGVILAGGRNTRFSGTNKAFLRLGGRRILDHICDLFSDMFSEILLVTNDPLPYLEWDLTIVPDLFPFRSSLTGIHSGLFFMSTPYAFFVSCDMPFVRRSMIEALFENAELPVDAVIPKTSKGFEPLCAVYSKRCLQFATRQLEKRQLKISKLFETVRTIHLTEDALRVHDPELASFFNINTPEELAQAEDVYRTLEPLQPVSP